MVSRPPPESQLLELQNAESTKVWIKFFVAKSCAEKKEDKINTHDTILDLQVIDRFLSMFGHDKIPNFRILMSPRNLIDTPYKNMRLANKKIIFS